MNRTRNSLEMNGAIEDGSWPQLTSKFWRCSLSMNRKMPCLEMNKLRIFRFMVPMHLKNERGLFHELGRKGSLALSLDGIC